MQGRGAGWARVELTLYGEVAVPREVVGMGSSPCLSVCLSVCFCCLTFCAIPVFLHPLHSPSDDRTPSAAQSARPSFVTQTMSFFPLITALGSQAELVRRRPDTALV